jgi:hypothetical protein
LSDEVDCVEKRKEKRFIINLFHAFLQHAWLLNIIFVLKKGR